MDRPAPKVLGAGARGIGQFNSKRSLLGSVSRTASRLNGPVGSRVRFADASRPAMASAGLEPARGFNSPGDFKSPASAIPPAGQA